MCLCVVDRRRRTQTLYYARDLYKTHAKEMLTPQQTCACTVRLNKAHIHICVFLKCIICVFVHKL